MASNMKLCIFLIANLTILVTCQVIREGCPEQCGNVTIPYPFGIGKDCALEDKLVIKCNHTFNPPQPFLASSRGALYVIDISLDGHLRKHTYVAADCYNRTGGWENSNNIVSSQLRDFFYSSTRNLFTVLGCDTNAQLMGVANGDVYASGCVSQCFNKSIVINGSCSGIGCCQSAIPKQLSKFELKLQSFSNHKSVWEFNPCSYAFIADVDYFNFSTITLLQMPPQVPTVLDWAVGDRGCKGATKNVSSYACKEHSECRDSDNGPGYRCFCSSGYTGNPYFPRGCLDVDECKDGGQNNCTHKCHNTEGSYTCSCPTWFHGDGRRDGQGCSLNKHRIILVIIGDGILLILILAGSLLIQNYIRQRMQRKLKDNFFKQNGGFILLDRISRNEENSINTMKIFKSEELKEATDNFSEAKICGCGGFGTVYKGHLSSGTIVAIKKSKIVDKGQTEQFINEITVLSQINHRNVVRFLGCCLETPVPLLVYEFITNGTLSDHIHNNNGPRIPWQTRLKIAAETAGVLAYLHTDHSPRIIHRDIKPTNILLDDDYTAKVSDFGASRLIPKNEVEMCTMVQGTLGYLDPEYLQTSQLTEKSDVYSFGVVLLELFTGLKAISFERSEEGRSLVMYVLSLSKEEDMLEILDKAMRNEDNMEKIKKVVKIAKMCVRVNGEERPTMKEVAMGLEGLSKELKHKWAASESNMEENEHLLGELSDNNCGNSIQMGEYSGTGEDFVLLKIADDR